MDQQFSSFSVYLNFLLVIFIVLRALKEFKNKSKSSLNPPPGPWKLPIIGNLHQLVLDPLPHRGLRDLATKYGPVMQLHLGQVPTIVISSAEAAKELLKTHDIIFADRPSLLVARILFYNCTDVGFAPYGGYWKQLRKICICELLSPKRVRSFRSVREEEVTRFITTIAAGKGLPVNLSKMLFSLTIDITARTSIGKKCKNQEALMPILIELIAAVGGFNVVDVFPSFKLLHMISISKYRLKKMHREADEILENIINERKANKVVDTKDSENEVEDLLDVLLNLQDDENLEYPLTTDGIKAIILQMFSGGSDTSITTLEWAMSEMIKNPTVMKKAQEEVRQAFHDTGNVDETRLDELKFFKLVIKETLRLHSGPFIPRECREACQIDGYDIDGKTRVIVNTWAIGRDPNYWTEPEKFYPDRFLGCSTDYRGNHFEFLPFGAGKRMCPGMLFGTTNVEFVLANLLYHFDWLLPGGEKPENLDMTEFFRGTVKRKRDLVLIPIPCSRLPAPHSRP